jgi:biopolymer transport protein ExbB
MDLFNPANAVSAINDYLQAGGPVVTVILVTTFVMWALIIERLIYFFTTERALAQSKREAWNARRDHSSWFAHAVRERLISEQRLANEQYLGVIKVLIVVTPLLGLLGTVTGMIEVFQVITSTGASNARLMASGISKATIPTMTGLAVSLSGIALINILERRSSLAVAGLGDSLDIRSKAQPASQEQ